ncbi:MAG: hypothetical protein JSU77_10825 [Fidelibacterota bacterium]|nr:MAG: hypothetical protein JSU77_10825 [Candidatus Neomarinimicrobiota bacterium]
MIENIPSLLKALGSAGPALEAFTNWRAKARGGARSLVEELKENSRYFWLFLEQDVELKEIIPQLSTSEYDRLCREGFNFNALKRKKIPNNISLEGTDLSSWQGKTTNDLVSSIYDKIKDLKTIYPYTAKSKNVQWKRRIKNIQKRILLLQTHVSSK